MYFNISCRLAYLELNKSSYDHYPQVFGIHHMPDLGLLTEGHADGLMECARYNPLGPSKPGILSGMEIKLSTKGILTWNINVHYLDHFTHGILMTFGTVFIEPDILRMAGFASFYEITPTEFEYLDTEEDPCIKQDEKDRKVNLWKCLEQNHIASKLNCTLPWLSDDKKSLCMKPEEYNSYHTLYYEVMDFDTDKVNKIGKCTPKCLRDEYSIRHFQTYETGTQDSWTLTLFFAKDRFHLRQQYYTYDFQQFLADFGGYLGLLLGTSIMGFYDTLMELLQKLIGNSKKKSKVKAGQRSQPKRAHRSMKTNHRI